MALKNRRDAVLNGELNFGFAVERRRVAPGALDGDLLRGWQAQSVKNGREQRQRIPVEHAVSPGSPKESRQREQKASGQKPDGALRESKGDAAARNAGGANRFGMEGRRDHPRGTATAATTSLSTRSASKPSSSASGLRRMR